MATTIKTTIKHGVYYSAASNNPLTIANTGAILTNRGSYALSLASSLEWTVVNNGQVSAGIGNGIDATLATITNTGLITAGGSYGIYLLPTTNAVLANAVVINSGTILDSRYVSRKPGWYAGVYFGAAGELTNQAGGLISGANNGVMTSYKDLYADDIINQGTIIGGAFNGVTGAARLTVVNSGSISGGTAGISANFYKNNGIGGTYVGGNVITNLAGGQINGGKYGISLTGSSTVTNAGTVSGASDSVIFAAGGTDRLIDDPGAVFQGTVNGGNAYGSTAITTLELASGATTGTLTGLGTGFTNFASVGVDAGANWVMSGTNTLASGATLTDAGNLTLASSLAGTGTLAFSGTGHTLTVEPGIGVSPTIAGFNQNAVAFVGVHATSASVSGHYLTLTGGGAPVTLTLAGTYSNTNFHVSYLSGATVLVCCFAEGTEIETEFGPLPVERLHPGMRIRTASGALRPLRWLGQRHHTLAEVATRDELRPVRIEAGALGQGLPHRTLRLSPEHALLLDGVLVPAIQLLGVPGIAQETEPDSLTYFHVELDTHDTILAEGAPSETYIDLASDAIFDNAATRPTPPATIPCAPRITSGPVLAAIRARLGAASSQPQPGALQGNIECATPGAIAGWAAAPDGAPIRLCIAADGIPLGTALANGFRFDLQRAGLGAVAFAFHGPVPQGARAIAITSEADGTHIPGSPFQLGA